VRDIIKREILDYLLSPKFVFVFLLCFILVVLSLYIGILNYNSELKEYRAAVALNNKNLENQPNYPSLAAIGMKINKSPQVLSTIVCGIYDNLGRVAKVTVAYDPSLIDSKLDSNPIYAIFGNIDLTYIVEIILSLFAILFTYDSIVGEKESGTLKLVISNNIPRYKIIIGKALGGYLSLLLPFTIPLILCLIILTIHPVIDFSVEDWIRISLIFLLYLLYISVFFSLGIFISSRTTSASNSLLILLFIWIFFVTIIPKLSIMIAGHLKKIPSVHEITAEKDAFLQQIQGRVPDLIQKWTEKNEDLKYKNSSEYISKYKKYLEELQNDLTSQIDKKNNSIEGNYQLLKRNQRKLAMNLSRISPASALISSTMRLARTGTNEHDRLLNSIRSYKPVFTQWVNKKMMSTVGTSGNQYIDITDMPKFEYSSEDLSNSVGGILPDLLILVLTAIMFLTSAYVSFLRYEI
jgi:ABC-type transport system involved in multi-copper enzyme maturation permease subunit